MRIDRKTFSREHPSEISTAPALKKADIRLGGMDVSASGLEAFERFFSNMPQGAELAIILIPRLEPTTIPARMPELSPANTAASRRGPYHIF